MTRADMFKLIVEASFPEQGEDEFTIEEFMSEVNAMGQQQINSWKARKMLQDAERAGTIKSIRGGRGVRRVYKYIGREA